MFAVDMGGETRRVHELRRVGHEGPYEPVIVRTRGEGYVVSAAGAEAGRGGGAPVLHAMAVSGDPSLPDLLQSPSPRGGGGPGGPEAQPESSTADAGFHAPRHIPYKALGLPDMALVGVNYAVARAHAVELRAHALAAARQRASKKPSWARGGGGSGPGGAPHPPGPGAPGPARTPVRPGGEHRGPGPVRRRPAVRPGGGSDGTGATPPVHSRIRPFFPPPPPSAAPATTRGAMTPGITAQLARANEGGDRAAAVTLSPRYVPPRRGPPDRTNGFALLRAEITASYANARRVRGGAPGFMLASPRSGGPGGAAAGTVDKGSASTLGAVAASVAAAASAASAAALGSAGGGGGAAHHKGPPPLDVAAFLQAQGTAAAARDQSDQSDGAPARDGRRESAAPGGDVGDDSEARDAAAAGEAAAVAVEAAASRRMSFMPTGLRTLPTASPQHRRARDSVVSSNHDAGSGVRRASGASGGGGGGGGRRRSSSNMSVASATSRASGARGGSVVSHGSHSSRGSRASEAKLVAIMMQRVSDAMATSYLPDLDALEAEAPSREAFAVAVFGASKLGGIQEGSRAPNMVISKTQSAQRIASAKASDVVTREKIDALRRDEAEQGFTDRVLPRTLTPLPYIPYTDRRPVAPPVVWPTLEALQEEANNARRSSVRGGQSAIERAAAAHRMYTAFVEAPVEPGGGALGRGRRHSRSGRRPSFRRVGARSTTPPPRTPASAAGDHATGEPGGGGGLVPALLLHRQHSGGGADAPSGGGSGGHQQHGSQTARLPHKTRPVDTVKARCLSVTKDKLFD